MLMFHRKQSEFDLKSKQNSEKLVRSGAVEEKVADMQGVRCANPCKAGKLL